MLLPLLLLYIIYCKINHLDSLAQNWPIEGEMAWKKYQTKITTATGAMAPWLANTVIPWSQRCSDRVHNLEQCTFDARRNFRYFFSCNTYCHNQAAAHIVSGLVFHKRTKHIKGRLSLCSRQDHEWRHCYALCENWDQLADVFTKPLATAIIATPYGKSGDWLSGYLLSRWLEVMWISYVTGQEYRIYILQLEEES